MAGIKEINVNHKVLLVDDGNERIEHVAGGLRTAGYEVVVVPTTSLAALQHQIRQYQPQFLMLDEDRVYDLSDKEFNINSVAAA